MILLKLHNSIQHLLGMRKNYLQKTMAQKKPTNGINIQRNFTKYNRYFLLFIPPSGLASSESGIHIVYNSNKESA